jgi:hypothetical protein
MAITDNQTAMQVATLLNFLLPSTLPAWNQSAVTAEQARVAAMALADASHKKMGAGVSAEQVQAAWYIDRARITRLEADPQPYERDERGYVAAVAGDKLGSQLGRAK